MSILIRGYAVPFDQLASLSDGLEFVRRGAFKDMISRRIRVRLQFDHHEDGALKIADTADGSLVLHEDHYGLAFQAELNARGKSTWAVMSAVVRGKHSGASVFFTDMICGAASLKGLSARRVDSATIAHITITDTPAYKGTAVWRGDRSLDDAPWKIRDLDARWEDGRTHEPAPTPVVRANVRASVISASAEARYQRMLAETAHGRAQARQWFGVNRINGMCKPI